jgi:hypothetical protein
MQPTRILSGIFLLCTAVADLSSADSLRCGDKLVSTGDRTSEVLSVCGEPFWRDTWDEVVTLKKYGETTTTSSTHEEWTYNFGPNEFVAFLHFEDGQLISVKNGGYGSLTGNEGTCEDGSRLTNGQSAGEVAMICGAPASRHRREETKSRKKAGEVISFSHILEDWTYVFGDKTLVLSFEDGHLIAINWQ